MNTLLKLFRKYSNWRWEIGFIDNTLQSVVEGNPLNIHWVNLPFRDRWFADPFILDYDDREITLLCEEYSDELKRGRIAKVVIDRITYEFRSWKIVLDLPTHLSFPRPVRKDGNVFIHPENSASGKHTIYKYDFEKDALLEGKIICDEPLTDSVMLEKDGRLLLFSTYEPNPNGNELTIYEKNGEKYNAKEKVKFDNNCARMAGDFFEVNGRLYRPAQDCNGDYGRAVIIQEAICERNGQWKFKDVRRIKSQHPTLKWGLHTFNHYKGLTVIDVKGACYPILGDALSKIRKLIR